MATITELRAGRRWVDRLRVAEADDAAALVDVRRQPRAAPAPRRCAPHGIAASSAT